MTPAQAQYCAPDQSPAPVVALELLNDTSFDWNCADWVYTGNATRISTGRRYVELTGTWSSMELSVYIDNFNGTSSRTERLHIEILDQWGALSETVDILSATSADGWYHYPLYGYNSGNITVRIRYAQATNPAGTCFEVSDVVLWAGL
jgi:hypothetical protein